MTRRCDTVKLPRLGLENQNKNPKFQKSLFLDPIKHPRYGTIKSTRLNPPDTGHMSVYTPLLKNGKISRIKGGGGVWRL